MHQQSELRVVPQVEHFINSLILTALSITDKGKLAREARWGGEGQNEGGQRKNGTGSIRFRKGTGLAAVVWLLLLCLQSQ